MLKISCPNDNNPERSYAVREMFEGLLGFKQSEYIIDFSNSERSYVITANEHQIIVEDHFFSDFPEPCSYMDEKNLPVTLSFFHGLGMEIPIVYGIDTYKQVHNKTFIGLDIFASTFFMLARWEECLLGREENGDCDETKLFAVRNHVEKRPIVHEYEFLLRELLNRCGILTRKRDYQVILTHDVDGINAPSYLQIAKVLVIDTLKNSIKLILGKKRFFSGITWKWKQDLLYKKHFSDSYTQFRLYVNLAKEHHIQEWFFFKVCSKGEVEATYLHDDERLFDVINHLENECGLNYQFGFHPSQSTFNNECQWNTEMNRISNLLIHTPSIGRNHHLLYNSATLHQWEQLNEKIPNDMMSVSNCVFHRRLGFRSGIAIPYTLFDIFQRKTIAVREYPCCIMDTAVRLAKYTSNEEISNDISYVIEQVKKYSGCLMLTWHIYVKGVELINEYYSLCRQTLEMAAQ